jgi:uncharacterized protein HemX
VAGRRTRPDANPDDWFAESESARPRRDAPPESPASGDELPPARDDGGDDWLAGGDSHAGAGGGSGLLHTLSEWRVVAGLVALVVVLVVGLAVGGVFNSKHRAAVTTAPTTATNARNTHTTTATTATTRAQTPAPTTTLNPGDQGSEVKALQQALKSLGYSVGTVDGVYGTSTKSAVASFQTASHLTSDGVFGPATLAALASALSGP